MLIENALPTDAIAIRQLAMAANIDAWAEADYFAETDLPGSFVLKAVIDGEICGFLLARTVPGSSEDPDVDLYNIAVKSEHLRRGVGTSLVTELSFRLHFTNVANIWLEVRESNEAAINFYKKHGFFKELTRPRFYTNPVENAVIMRLKLTPGRQG